MSETALLLERITIRYGSFVAVQALDLEVRRGELFGLLGPNGAGKSTTLRLLIGQLAPSEGRASLFGLDLGKDWERIKPRFGYVPDRDNHFEELTGRRNLELFADLYGLDRGRVDACLAQVELAEAAEVAVRGYSAGMRKKLLIARALLHQPELFVLDEPTANLDVHTTRIVHRLLRELTASGASVLLTTHDMEEVEALCDRIAVLQAGRRIALGTPAELRRDHARHRVDVLATDGSRRLFDLELAEDRAALAALIAEGSVSSLRSRTADLRAAFLELTGREAT
jgi:ABC-2 type transport system ATP-binding protein